MALEFESDNKVQLSDTPGTSVPLGVPSQNQASGESSPDTTGNVRPMTMGRYAQNIALGNGEYISSNGALYHQRDGRIFQVTGSQEGDRELNQTEAATLLVEKGQGVGLETTPPETSVYTDVSSGPRPTPTPRKRTEMYSGDVEPGTNPMNPNYDPESEAVRGKGGEHLSQELKDRLRERLKGTPFQNMDLDSLKLYRGKTPWFMHPGRGGITLENHIYMGDSRFAPENNSTHFDTLVEEAVHAGQFQYGDMTRAGYLLKSVPNGYIGNPHEDQAWKIAYPPDGIPYGLTPAEATKLIEIRRNKDR